MIVYKVKLEILVVLFSFVGHVNAVMTAYGPPIFFLTLSCAEFEWEDVQKVLRERRRLSGEAESEWIHCTNMELIEGDPCGFSQQFFDRFKRMWSIITGIIV